MVFGRCWVWYSFRFNNIACYTKSGFVQHYLTREQYIELFLLQNINIMHSLAVEFIICTRYGVWNGADFKKYIYLHKLTFFNRDIWMNRVQNLKRTPVSKLKKYIQIWLGYNIFKGVCFNIYISYIAWRLNT